jgi:signal transduction histidine kinase
MAFVVATLLATALAVTTLGLRVVTNGSVPGMAPDSIPLLFTAACLCLAGLLRRRLAPAAWFATAVATGLAGLELVGLVRWAELDGRSQAWLQLVEVAELGLIAASAIVALHVGKNAAGQTTGRSLVWRGIALSGFATSAVFAAWVLAAAATGDLAAVSDGSEVSGFRVGARLALGWVLVAALIGLGRDLIRPTRDVLSRVHRPADVPRAILEQLLPSAAASRRAWQEAERARLAGDLHALVLPDLRRAVRTADAYGEVGQVLSTDLRRALDGVERLMQGRESVVFEEFGLVAALEWLAERTEHEGLTVNVQLDGALTDPGTFAKPVPRSAFRVAMLAVDNVVRHAAASTVELRLQTTDAALQLLIIDDGQRPLDADRRTHGRGLRDIRAAAAEVGASVDLQSSGVGTILTFRWLGGPEPAGNHVMIGVDSADRANATPA